MFRKNTTRRASAEAMVPGEGRVEVSVKVRGGGREKGGKWVGGRDRREEWGRGWHYQKWHTLLIAHIRLDRVNGNERLPFTLTLEHHPLTLSLTTESLYQPSRYSTLFRMASAGYGGLHRTPQPHKNGGFLSEAQSVAKGATQSQEGRRARRAQKKALKLFEKTTYVGNIGRYTYILP